LSATLRTPLIHGDLIVTLQLRRSWLRSFWNREARRARARDYALFVLVTRAARRSRGTEHTTIGIE
jgi:hypothetical protein